MSFTNNGPIIENAKVDYTSLNIERGFLSGTIGFDYGGSGQGLGGIVLFNSGKGDVGGQFVHNILHTLNCEQWEDLKGRPVRVEHDNERVYRVGHYLEDKWFVVEDMTIVEGFDGRKES